MARGKTQPKKANRPSTAQVVFAVLTVVIILSFVLTLFINP
jgi:hypothetical protein